MIKLTANRDEQTCTFQIPLLLGDELYERVTSEFSQRLMAKMWRKKNMYQKTEEHISWQQQRELVRFTARDPEEQLKAEAITGG